MLAIDLKNLDKIYGTRRVLQRVSFQVSVGEVYGLLGPDGAGKTTLLHILMGFLKPTGGTINMLGSPNLDDVRGRVGYLPERFAHPLRYTAREYLSFLGKLSDIDSATLPSRVDAELARVGLSEVADQNMTSYSRGMLQRLGIAQALLTSPDLLLLDEPTTGMDASFRYELVDILAHLRAHGTACLLCTHHLDVVEQLCDRVGVLLNGKLLSEIDVRRLRGLGASVNIQVSHLSYDVRTALERLSTAVHCGEHVVTLRPNNHELQTTVLRALLDANVTILELEALERPLEHAYLEAIRATSSRQRPAAQPVAATTEPEHTETSRDDGDAPDTPDTAKPHSPIDSDTLLRELLESSNKQHTSSPAPTSSNTPKNKQSEHTADEGRR